MGADKTGPHVPVFYACFYAFRPSFQQVFDANPSKSAYYRMTGRRKQHPQKDRARWPVIWLPRPVLFIFIQC